MVIIRTQWNYFCVLPFPVVPVIGSDGGTIQYPSSEKAGQLYVYRRSPSIAVLLTRGLPKDGGVAVGIGEEAAGVYKCVARNVMETDIKTVSIDIMNGLFPS